MATTGGKNLLGIYISPKEICIAQVKIGSGSKPECEHLVKFPTGFEVKEGMLRPLSLNHEFFNEKASWVGPLKQAVKKVSWGSSSVVVTLSPQFSILRYFLMPSVDRRFWSRSIPLESKKYIPVSFEEVVYDYNAVPVEGGKKMGVLFGLTQRKSVEFIISTLKAAGLELAAVEINSVSMERLFGVLDKSEHDSKGYIHFSGNSTLMLFSHGGYPVLFRENDGDASGTMSERRRLDVKGAVQFVDRYVGGKDYKHIMLSGDGTDVWKPLAEKEAAPIPVDVWDAAGACGLKDSDASALFAIGAALRGRVPGKMLLDISGISTAIGLEKQVQSYVWNITFIVGGFLLLLSLITQVRLSIINSTVSSLDAKVGNVADLQGNDAEAINAKIARLQDNVRILSALIADTDTLAPKLSAIAERIPTELWLGELQYSNPFAVVEAAGSGKDLRLTGETMLKGELKIRVVDSFTKGLKTAEEFKVFYPPMGSIDSTTDSEGGASAAVQAGAGERAGKPTGFSIMCTSKRK